MSRSVGIDPVIDSGRLSENGQGRKSRFLFFSMVAVLVSVALGIPLGYRMICAHCDRLNRQVAETIAQVLDDYRVRHGIYPEELEDLTPEYFEAIPGSPCDLFGRSAFKLMACSREDALLLIPAVDRPQVQRYHLQEKRWLEPTSTAGMFTEIGACMEYMDAH